MDGSSPRLRSRLGFLGLTSITLSILQLVCGIVILGLVGVRFGRASFSSAVYSIVVSVLTILTCLILAYQALRPPQRSLFIVANFTWQAMLVILWAAAAGTLGSHGNRARSTGLRAAMVLAIIEMLTFLIGSVIGGLALWRGRRHERKLNEGM